MRESPGRKEKKKTAPRPDIPDCIVLCGPRACGKTSVGQALIERLPDWRYLDLDDEYQLRCRCHPDLRNELLATNRYYDICHEILEEQLGSRQLVIGLGGGALANSTSPNTCLENLQLIRQLGVLVLLLPSRFDFLNCGILHRRERRRKAYRITKEDVAGQYSARIPYLRNYADFTVHGGSPANAANKIIRFLRMHEPGSGVRLK